MARPGEARERRLAEHPVLTHRGDVGSGVQSSRVHLGRNRPDRRDRRDAQFGGSAMAPIARGPPTDANAPEIPFACKGAAQQAAVQQRRQCSDDGLGVEQRTDTLDADKGSGY